MSGHSLTRSSSAASTRTGFQVFRDTPLSFKEYDDIFSAFHFAAENATEVSFTDPAPPSSSSVVSYTDPAPPSSSSAVSFTDPAPPDLQVRYPLRTRRHPHLQVRYPLRTRRHPDLQVFTSRTMLERSTSYWNHIVHVTNHVGTVEFVLEPHRSRHEPCWNGRVCAGVDHHSVGRCVSTR